MRVWPCFIMVFARNCPKGPNPTIPILRVLDNGEDEETAMVSQRERDRVEPCGGGGVLEVRVGL